MPTILPPIWFKTLLAEVMTDVAMLPGAWKSKHVHLLFEFSTVFQNSRRQQRWVYLTLLPERQLRDSARLSVDRQCFHTCQTLSDCCELAATAKKINYPRKSCTTADLRWTRLTFSVELHPRLSRFSNRTLRIRRWLCQCAGGCRRGSSLEPGKWRKLLKTRSWLLLTKEITSEL